MPKESGAITIMATVSSLENQSAAHIIILKPTERRKTAKTNNARKDTQQIASLANHVDTRADALINIYNNIFKMRA